MAIRVEIPGRGLQDSLAKIAKPIRRVLMLPGIVEEIAREIELSRPFYEVDLPDLQHTLQERLEAHSVCIRADMTAPRCYRAVIDLGVRHQCVGVMLHLGDNVAYRPVNATAYLWEESLGSGEYRRLRFNSTTGKPIAALDTLEHFIHGMFDKVLQPDQIKPL